MKKIVLFFISLLIFVTSINAVEYRKAEVEEIMSQKNVLQQRTHRIERQKLLVKILNGENKGKIVELIHDFDSDHPRETALSKGDNIIVSVEKNNYYFYSFDRTISLIIVIIIFLVVIISVGRLKGIKALMSLIATLSLLFLFYVPFIIKGVSIVALTIFVASLSIIITILILNGFSIKSFSSIIGIIFGLIFSGILALIVIKATNLSGINLNSSQMLKYLPQNIKIDFSGLLLSSIIIGALCAVMDVGVELAASMQEIKMANVNIDMKEHIKRGFNVGRDIIGTMTNTLILAYTGSTLPLLIVITAYKWPLIKILNLDIIASEILRALAGSIGLILCIPATIFVSAYFLNEKYGKE